MMVFGFFRGRPQMKSERSFRPMDVTLNPIRGNSHEKGHLICVVLMMGCCLMGMTTGCACLPKDISRPPSYAINDGHDSALGRKFEQTMA